MSLLTPEGDKDIIQENTETISKDIASVVDQKKVITPEQRGMLNGFSLSNEMQDAYNAKLA
jgi:hypothetical protein